VEYRGQAIIGVWFGVVALSALFLYFDFVAEVILALVFGGILMTVYIIRQAPDGQLERQHLEKLMEEITNLKATISEVDQKVEDIKKLIEE
jgi:ABC-type bacteriocin/lantibiotic exporter with double-glycine peptidase domain